MNEISKNMRTMLVQTLVLISSEEEQVKYQHEVSHVDVSAELFNQWDDSFFPDDVNFREAFSNEEIVALGLFNAVLSEVAEETPHNLPALDDFVKTQCWRRLSRAAHEALVVLNRPNSGQTMALNRP
ncbi:MAG: hypothetical protein HOP03_10965 [Lysobacter sp.]|nr:hypothetical protein [Lysobacter sp.]